jgi:glycerol-3-phosphate acyltransferase PlsY
MEISTSLIVLVLGYVLGAIPFGYMLVRMRTGQDIRDVHSGRTGGTNAMRAAGKRIGFLTGAFDVLKGFAAVLVAGWLAPGDVWLAVLAPAAAILGHNYSLFLVKMDGEGRVQFSGGAGGAPAFGGAMALWSPNLFIILPIAGLVYYFIGYASVTTLSASVLAIIVFGVRAAFGWGPWEYIFYGVAALILTGWALRPNIRRLLDGTERIHGYRARSQKKRKPARKKSRPVSRVVARQH